MSHRIDEFQSSADRFREYEERRREEAIARWGLPADVQCVDCGDSGFDLEYEGVPCRQCERGEDILRQRAWDDTWTRQCPPRFAEYSFESHPNQDAVQLAQRWADTGLESGRNLFLAGTVGSGKTGLAIATLRYLVTQMHKRVLFGSMPALMDGLRPQSGDSPGGPSLESMQKVPVLLLDDLGVEKPSEWQAERLYLIVNDRYERRMPTMMTTNHNRRTLENVVGERIMSRLMEDVQVIQMGGDDLRKRGA